MKILATILAFCFLALLVESRMVVIRDNGLNAPVNNNKPLEKKATLKDKLKNLISKTQRQIFHLQEEEEEDMYSIYKPSDYRFYDEDEIRYIRGVPDYIKYRIIKTPDNTYSRTLPLITKVSENDELKIQHFENNKIIPKYSVFGKIQRLAYNEDELVLINKDGKEVIVLPYYVPPYHKDDDDEEAEEEEIEEVEDEDELRFPYFRYLNEIGQVKQPVLRV